MRLKPTTLWLTVLIVAILLAPAEAGFWDWLTGSSSSTESVPAASSSASLSSSTVHDAGPTSSSSSAQQSSSSSSSSAAVASSSVAPPLPSSTHSSVSQHPTVGPFSSSSNTGHYPTQAASMSDSQSSAQPSATSAAQKQQGDGNNKTGIIVGSVVGVFAVIGGALALALFARRKKNGQNRQRLQDPQIAGDVPYDSNRPSPAMAAAAANDIHYQYHPQYAEQSYHNGSYSPQPPPMVAADPYYQNSMSQQAMNPNMSYPDAAFSGAYYTASPQPGQQQLYYDQQQQAYHDPYAMQQQQPVYSAPNAYDQNEQRSQNTYMASPPMQQHQQPFSYR